MPAKKVTDIPAEVLATVQKIWQAGLGAVTLAQDEGSKVLSTLVSVGEQMEKEIKRSGLTPSAAVKTAREGAGDAWKKAQVLFDSQVTGALHRLGVPTKDEIGQLTRRIEALTASIENLRSAPARRARAKATQAARKRTRKAR
jgi:poly(hydroxyalkanoate) granule-associated protein